MEWTTTVFRHGNGQAVRLPKELRLRCREMIVQRFGGMLILVPKIHRKNHPRAQPRSARRRRK